jgi:hypothetical protein
VVGEAKRTQAVLHAVLQDALGPLMQIIGATGKTGVNVKIVVDLITHDNSPFKIQADLGCCT